MKKGKVNILVVGLLQTGSSALVDLLREYDNLNIIPGEFNDFRAPGLVADQLCSQQNNAFLNEIEKLTKIKSKIGLLYNILPIFKWERFTIKGIKGRFVSSIIRIRQLSLLKKLNNKLSSNISFEDKIRYANQWITDIGNINIGNNEFVVFNQPLLTGIDTNVWKKIFHPYKLIIVYRDPKDQLTEIIKKGNLYKLYGAPIVNFGGVALETIYGRSRNGAITIHNDAIKKRYEWIDSLKRELDSDRFLLIDFEGMVNCYDEYKTVIENFIGNTKPHHKNQKLYFDPKNAKKNIGIYKEYLNDSDIESLKELENWYKNKIKCNNILQQ